ncbi:MAG TPA: OmpA family protein [Candidatus Acidoferrales bacterium]|nr:OmpA family protein [Candidatus Acidoferrales bacterium]
MTKSKALALVPALVMLLALISAVPAFAQDGKLKIKVSPNQAYIFVDGNAIRQGSRTINLTAGKHTIGVYNYGYTSQTQEVDVVQGKTTNLSVTLQKAGGDVSGPFGDIELQGDRAAAVLLNGKTPEYFVGHVDEFDWNWLWHQRLLVHPGTYQIDVTRNGQTVWSGQVNVAAGKQVTINLHNGTSKTKNWKQGNTLGAQPRFKAGMASSTVAVAPVSGSFSADKTQINCGDSAQLTWNSTDAVDVNISEIGKVDASGSKTVSPTKTTTYNFSASGPGGIVTNSQTINVNIQPTATLTLNPTEVKYHKIGDKVKEDGTATLSWTSSNASQVSIDPIGSVQTSGSQTITALPKQQSIGPIDENQTYTMTATNVCGGSATQTATLHITGSIEPMPVVTLQSVFYSTAYPVKEHPDVGLVKSEEQSLDTVAATFKKYLDYDDTARLVVVGHADVRGSSPYNEALSQRRADRVRDYLVSQGISADKIETRAEGKERQLDRSEVTQLQQQDPAAPQKWMMHRDRDTWLAYNRRVDIILQPTGQESTKYYPNGAPEARILFQVPKPSLSKVREAESGMTAPEEPMHKTHRPAAAKKTAKPQSN